MKSAITLIIRLPSNAPLQLDLGSFVSDVVSQFSNDAHVDVSLVPRRPTFAALVGQNAVTLRPPIPKELPHFANFENHVQVKVRHQHIIFVAAGLREDLAPRIAEITLAIELANAPWLLFAHAVDGPDKITVGDGVRGLLQLPQVFGQASHGRRGIENNLRSVQSQGAGSFGKVPVVTDVHADLGKLGIEHGVAQVPRREVKLFPESRMTVRNM